MNLSNLNNITPYTVNDSLINETSTIGVNIVQNANQTSGGYFGIGMMIVVFLFLLIILSTDQDVFRLGFLSALIASSGIVLTMGIIMLFGNIISSFQHLMWIAIIFALAIAAKYNQENR